MAPGWIQRLAAECGFELAGVAAARPLAEAGWYQTWAGQGMAGAMRYLTDHRAEVRQDPRRLLPAAESIVCVGKLYRGPEPHSTERSNAELGWISRYAWGDDYHDIMRAGLDRLAKRLREETGQAFDHRICVDTAPLLERAYARQAGLGWIGKNGCLINEQQGSWFFLGELLISLSLLPDLPPPDRCGTCTRCIDACPTAAIVPNDRVFGPAYTVDARQCIAYFTIELRGPVPEQARPGIGRHVFGCDICQDVCPWNRRAPSVPVDVFAPRAGMVDPPLERLAALTETEFNEVFRHTPVSRAKYAGFLRNVAIAMGNSGAPNFREPLKRLAQYPDPLVAEHAAWALEQLPQAVAT